jgi:hypothetical protein
MTNGFDEVPSPEDILTVDTKEMAGRTPFSYLT